MQTFRVDADRSDTQQWYRFDSLEVEKFAQKTSPLIALMMPLPLKLREIGERERETEQSTFSRQIKSTITVGQKKPNKVWFFLGGGGELNGGFCGACSQISIFFFF